MRTAEDASVLYLLCDPRKHSTFARLRVAYVPYQTLLQPQSDLLLSV